MPTLVTRVPSISVTWVHVRLVAPATPLRIPWWSTRAARPAIITIIEKDGLAMLITELLITLLSFFLKLMVSFARMITTTEATIMVVLCPTSATIVMLIVVAVLCSFVRRWWLMVVMVGRTAAATVSSGLNREVFAFLDA